MHLRVQYWTFEPFYFMETMMLGFCWRWDFFQLKGWYTLLIYFEIVFVYSMFLQCFGFSFSHDSKQHWLSFDRMIHFCEREKKNQIHICSSGEEIVTTRSCDSQPKYRQRILAGRDDERILIAKVTYFFKSLTYVIFRLSHWKYSEFSFYRDVYTHSQISRFRSKNQATLVFGTKLLIVISETSRVLSRKCTNFFFKISSLRKKRKIA